jgi:hypothetical protein
MLSGPRGRVIEDGSYRIVCCGHFQILLFLNLFESEVDICLLLVEDERCAMREIEPIISKSGETGIQRGNTGLSRLILCLR